MIHENINIDRKLKGQYRFSVLEDDNIVYSTPWCNNTILSSGLVDLFSYDIPTILNYLDIGLSRSLPGSLGYGLSSGVITNSEFKNIKRDIIESYNDSISSKLYIASFTTKKALSSFNINEFAIKRDTNVAFARNVFPSSYTITTGQYINFEYRLGVLWSATHTGNMQFQGNSTNYTYSLPITSTTYNIPYENVYYKNNYLVLINKIYNSDGITINNSLPSSGDNYPAIFDWGLGSVDRSVYAPVKTLTAIDNVNRLFTVTTCYTGIQVDFDQDNLYYANYALLVKDGDLSQPTNKFNITKFAYPLILFNNNAVCLPSAESSNVYNVVEIGYNYTWGECSNIQLQSAPESLITTQNLENRYAQFTPPISARPATLSPDGPLIDTSVQSPVLVNFSNQVLGLTGSEGPPIFLIPLNANSNFRANSIMNLTVSVSGLAPISYKWYKDNKLITNVLSSTYIDNNILPHEAGIYKVVATNSIGSITGTSNVAIDTTYGVTYNLSSNRNGFELMNYMSLSTTNAGYSAVNVISRGYRATNLMQILLRSGTTYNFDITGTEVFKISNYRTIFNIPRPNTTTVKKLSNNNIKTGRVVYTPSASGSVLTLQTLSGSKTPSNIFGILSTI
jgi:hypothetical protein